MPPRKPPPRGRPFQKGFDPRRHILTTAERRRGGINCARKYTIRGPWPLAWMDYCSNRKKGEY
jgi:hypothetical protein